MAKIAFFGSDYVSSFAEFCEPQGLRVPGEVKFFGRDGMTAKDATTTQEFQNLIEFQPDVVFVILGGNDITDDCIPQNIFHDIQNLVGVIQGHGIPRVYVCGIIHKGNFTNSPGITKEKFEKIRKAINKKIYKTFDQHCVRMRDIKYPQHYDGDKVHLNEKGLRTYFFMFRRIVCSLKF